MKLSAVLRLCRIPNVFTAFADVAAGAILARGGALELDDLRLIGASGLLYVAGMVLNDYFDREVDARERPERPIPSGEVPVNVACLFGFGALGAGVALASTAGATSLSVALALATAIVLYDGGLKQTGLGPLCMGTCRFFNVALGLSVAWHAPSPWAWTLPIALGLYTVVITYWSRFEVAGAAAARGRQGVLMMAALLVAFVIAMSILAPARHFPAVLAALPFLLFVVVRGASLFRPLLSEATPPLLGRAIGGGILMMPAIDATVVAGAGHFVAACGVFLLALPAYALKRRFYVT